MEFLATQVLCHIVILQPKISHNVRYCISVKEVTSDAAILFFLMVKCLPL